MIKRYVNKPIEIEAVQYDGNNINEVQDFCHEKIEEMFNALEIGDYVMKDNKGCFSTCENNLFQKNYEELDERRCVCAQSLY